MTALNESLSDADTQEPVNTELNSRHVPDSDDDSVVMAPVEKPSDKAAAAIEPINSDSDHSDDEQNSDPPVDFGEEEEDDDFAPQNEKRNKSPVKTKRQDDGKVDNDAQDKGTSSDVDRTKAPEKKRDDARSPSPKKKTKSKGKELSPSKAIKKPKAESKTKPKAVKSKQSTTKKSTQSAKPKNGSRDVSPKPSANSSTASSPRKTPKTASPQPKKSSKTKPLVRKAARSSSKADASVQQRSKSLKVKKTIDKEDAPKEKKSPTPKKGKTNTTVNTFSKKAKKGTAESTKPHHKGKKESKEKKTKQKKSTTARSSKTLKGKKDEPEHDDEEENAQMEVDSEGEDPVSDKGSYDEDTVRTPSSKMQILGNLACSSRDQNAQALLEHAVQQLRRYNIVTYNAETNSSLTAYIIGKETKRGWGVLQALVSGVPLVSDNWLSSSISEGKWVSMNDFRSDRFGQSPRSVNSAAEGPAKLLDGLRVRVISNEKDAASIRKVVRLCGARLAETRVDVVINDSKKKVEGCPNVQKKWLADSIESGVPLDYEPYLVGGG